MDMPPRDVEMRVFRDPGWRAFSLYAFQRVDHNRRSDKCGRLVFDVPYEAGDQPQATARLEPEDAQVLMDSLWDAGLRPTQGHGTAGQLSATQAHLDDMRAITADKLKVQLPNPKGQ